MAFSGEKSERFPHIIMLSLLCNKARGRGGNPMITGFAVREGTLIRGRKLPLRTCSKCSKQKVSLNHSLINIYLFIYLEKSALLPLSFLSTLGFRFYCSACLKFKVEDLF